MCHCASMDKLVRADAAAVLGKGELVCAEVAAT